MWPSAGHFALSARVAERQPAQVDQRDTGACARSRHHQAFKHFITDPPVDRPGVATPARHGTDRTDVLELHGSAEKHQLTEHASTRGTFHAAWIAGGYALMPRMALVGQWVSSCFDAMRPDPSRTLHLLALVNAKSIVSSSWPIKVYPRAVAAASASVSACNRERNTRPS